LRELWQNKSLPLFLPHVYMDWLLGRFREWITTGGVFPRPPKKKISKYMFPSYMCPCWTEDLSHVHVFLFFCSFRYYRCLM
jgi:hypothetical protein